MKTGTGTGGFTLLEVLIALALTAAIMGAVYVTFDMVDKAREGASESLLRLYEAQKAMDIMKKEIESVKGSFIVTDKEFLGSQTSSLTFSCFSPRRGVITTVSYSLKPDGDQFDLLKRSELPGGPVVEAVLLEEVQAFTIETLGIDGKWQKTWPGGNPTMVRLLLKIPFRGSTLTLTEVAVPRIGNQI